MCSFRFAHKDIPSACSSQHIDPTMQRQATTVGATLAITGITYALYNYFDKDKVWKALGLGNTKSVSHNVILLGKTGSGKSSLINVVAMLEEAGVASSPQSATGTVPVLPYNLKLIKEGLTTHLIDSPGVYDVRLDGAAYTDDEIYVDIKRKVAEVVLKVSRICVLRQLRAIHLQI
jgi:putative ribosome biogenesis GTPase RsgA